ncbi:MAG TPA: hypothetical protein DEF51_06260 [Myxococcales bacterium]|nr:hypothetical protein [Myxococcales bacterium]
MPSAPAPTSSETTRSNTPHALPRERTPMADRLIVVGSKPSDGGCSDISQTLGSPPPLFFWLGSRPGALAGASACPATVCAAGSVGSGPPSSPGAAIDCPH